MSATIVQMDLPGLPEVRIEGVEDARELVAILFRNGVRVNLRGATAHSTVSDHGNGSAA